nr:MAG TPA: hypothetical protein [Caudoviricetes sp.]
MKIHKKAESTEYKAYRRIRQKGYLDKIFCADICSSKVIFEVLG